MLNKLQYISQGRTAPEQILNILAALDNGATWIQLRWKEGNYKQKQQLAGSVLKMCRAYKATCIINDHIDLAKTMDADGVHLGLSDESITKARDILGKDKIVGGTANTLAEVVQRTAEGCDYIGLGPLRFTRTKEKLRPVLGLQGYQKIIVQLQEQSIKTPPIYAIGGIEIADITELQKAGIYGIALSGLISRQPVLIPQIKKLLS